MEWKQSGERVKTEWNTDKRVDGVEKSMECVIIQVERDKPIEHAKTVRDQIYIRNS
ncbi:hypothetical protein ACE4RR_16070 [Alteribacillus sp. HJP-4]